MKAEELSGINVTLLTAKVFQLRQGLIISIAEVPCTPSTRTYPRRISAVPAFVIVGRGRPGES
jgi:hypothetical protein